MRFDHRVIRPFANAVAKLPGTQKVGVGAGPNGQTPTLNVTAFSHEEADFVDELVSDRIGIFKVDVQADPNISSCTGDVRADHEKLEDAKDAIAKLPGVKRVSSDRHRLVVAAGDNENAKFLSQLLEDNIYGKDVFFQVR